MAPGLLDRFFGAQDASQQTPDALAPSADPFAVVSDKDKATSALNSLLATADVGRPPDIAYRSTILPMAVTTTGQIVPDGHAGLVYGAAQALGALPQIGRQLANEPIMTSDPNGAITDTGGVAGADTAGALNAAATLGAGGSIMPRPAASLGMFAGRAAKTANQAAADLSEQALARGATDQQVYDAGGWFPGVDRKMRFEIDDRPAVYTGAGSTVGEALDHPDLYAAYPGLQQMPFSTQDLGTGSYGHFDGNGVVINSALPASDAKDILLHELQHAVQNQEGFAKGGNITSGFMGGATMDERLSAYRSLAGEVEARNVQTRAAMPAGDRPAPWETQDTPYINQNPHFSITNGMATSVSPPRLLNDAPLNEAQQKAWMFGGLGAGSERVPGVEGTGFYYPDLPNVMATEGQPIAASLGSEFADRPATMGAPQIADQAGSGVGAPETTLSSQSSVLPLLASAKQPHQGQTSMADGLFDDLIPAAPASAPTGSSSTSGVSFASAASVSSHPLFDDLVPAMQPSAPAGLRNVATAKDDPIYHGAVPIAQAPDQGASTAFGSGVGGVPIFGPMLEGGLQRAAAYGRSLAHGTSYDAELQHVQDMVDAARQQHPAAALAGDLTGAVSAMAPVVAVAPEVFGAGPGGLSAGKIAAGAASGAGIGGTDAAVRSGGDPVATIKGVAEGAALGGAGPVIGAGLGRIGQGVADVYGRLATPNPGVSRPAADILTRTIANDGQLGPQGLQAIGDAGPRGMLVDASPSLSGVLDAALQRGGPGAAAARQAIETRTAGAGQDVNAALDQALGPAQGIYTTEDGIRVGSAAARQQAYDAAYAAPIDYSSPAGRTVEDIITNRVPPGIIARAQSQMRVDGVLPPQQTMARIADDGTVTYQSMPDVQMVDYITRSLNDVARAGDGQGALGGNTAEGRSYGMLAQDLRGALRSAVPAYGDALDTAAQPIDARNALQFGASMLSPSVPRDVVAGTIDGMTGPELAQVRGGVRAHIADTLGNVSRTISDPNVDARGAMTAVKMLSSDAANDKLGMLLGPDEAQSISTALDRAGTSLDLRSSVSRNSATAARLGTNDTIAQATEPGLIKQALAAGGPMKATRPFAQFLLGTRPQDIAARQTDLYGELASALTSPAANGGSGLFDALLQGHQVRSGASAIAGSIPYTPAAQAGLLALSSSLQSRAQ